MDLTPVEGEQLGLHTYAVVSPDLVPLDCVHAERFLGHPRLLTGPELNEEPHPLP